MFSNHARDGVFNTRRARAVLRRRCVEHGVEGLNRFGAHRVLCLSQPVRYATWYMQ